MSSRPILHGTALLEQLSDPTSVPLNLTSNPFAIGVRRDLVPDLS